MATSGEKLLILEIVVTEIVVTVRELSKGTVPKPSQYVASLMVFAVLGGVASINEQFSKAAAAFGAVVLITTLVNDPAPVDKLFKVGASKINVKSNK